MKKKRRTRTTTAKHESLMGILTETKKKTKRQFFFNE